MKNISPKNGPSFEIFGAISTSFFSASGDGHGTSEGTPWKLGPPQSPQVSGLTGPSSGTWTLCHEWGNGPSKATWVGNMMRNHGNPCGFRLLKFKTYLMPEVLGRKQQDIIIIHHPSRQLWGVPEPTLTQRTICPLGARNTFHHHLQGEKGAESQWSQGILVRTGYVYLSLIYDILTMERQGHFFDEISLSVTVQFICDVEFAGPLFSWGARLAISSHCDIDSFCSWDVRQHLQARITCQCVYSAQTK